MPEAKNPYTPHDHEMIEGCVACVWDEGKEAGKPDIEHLANFISGKIILDWSGFEIAGAILAEFHPEDKETS